MTNISTFDDLLPLVAVRIAPGEYDIRDVNARTLWRMEGAALADFVCQSINGRESERRAEGLVRDRLRWLLNEVVDANYGGEYDDIERGVGHGDGISQQDAVEIVLECRRYRAAKAAMESDTRKIVNDAIVKDLTFRELDELIK